MPLHVFAFALSAALASPHPFQAVLEKACAEATPGQCRELVDAVDASPTLARELDDLVAANLLATVDVVKDSAAPAQAGFHLNASYGDRSMTFTEGFLQHAVGERVSQTIRPDDVLPNHLVFALGHLARHLRLAPEMAEFRKNHLLELQAEQREAQERHVPHDATAWVAKGIQKRMEEEASAWIVGWNDMIEAGAASNGGVPVTLAQASGMLLNFHYRPTVISAMNLKDNKAAIDVHGLFPLDAYNVAAFVSALRTARGADVQ